MILNLPPADRYVIITDDTVRELYGNAIQQQLQCDLLSIPPGEASKSRAMKEKLEEELFELGCDRGTMIIALGGGVVGDLAGYVAATYMRGIKIVHIPTTLLAMVDSSIGGKSGINTPQGKNLIGAFWPATKIILNVDHLQTLPDEHLKDGLVEAIKVFITHDLEAFNALDIDKILSKERDTLEALVTRAATHKANIVHRDELEKNERQVLNFGHTVGHALEKLNNYKLMHGHAVALGILVEAKMAELEGFLPSEDFTKLESTLSQLGHDQSPLKNHTPEEIFEAMKNDKKTKNGVPKYVLLKEIGKVEKFAHDLEEARLREALNHF